MNRSDKLWQLRQVNRRIAGAEMAVMQQIACFDKLCADGHDTTLAERGLRAFAASLEALRGHRQLIVSTIQQIDRGHLT